MPVRYYIAPFEQITIGQRSPFASRCLTHIRNEEPSAGHWAIKATPWQNWCLTCVDASLATHAVIEADPDVTLVPFEDAGGNYLTLTDTVQDVSPANRTAISNFLEARNIPTDWITLSTTIGQVVNFTLRYLQIIQLLKDDYISEALDLTVGDIPAAKRGRIIDWMDTNEIDRSDINNSTPIRTAIRLLIERYGWKRVTSRALAWSANRE